MSTDILKRFLFEELNIRGQLVVLENTTSELFRKHHYPDPLKDLLGEMACASLLLSSTLKIKGSTTLQATGSGPVTTLMAEATHQHTTRGICRYELSSDHIKTLPAKGTPALLGEPATLAITLTPLKGERYQGLVRLHPESLAESLEDYFQNSEQLHTRLWFFNDGTRWGGLLLQELPASKDEKRQTSEEDWERITVLADTVTTDEILMLDANDLLHRLFHEETVRVFGDEQCSFWCSCSEERTSDMIRSLGSEEAFSILDEQGSIEVDCQFCFQHYSFSRESIEKLFDSPTFH